MSDWGDKEEAEYKARKAREKARIRVKMTNIVGLIARVALEKDPTARERATERAVDAFLELMEHGPGPDPAEKA